MAERLLEVDRISKRYGDLFAVEDLSLRVGAGFGLALVTATHLVTIPNLRQALRAL